MFYLLESTRVHSRLASREKKPKRLGLHVRKRVDGRGIVGGRPPFDLVESRQRSSVGPFERHVLIIYS